jgi:nitronate monooxygenase
VNLDVHLRARGGVYGQHRGQAHRGGGLQRTDRDLAARHRPACDGLSCFGDETADALGVWQEPLAGTRQHDPSAAPMKQRHAELRFEQSNALRHVRLHGVERPSRLRHRPGPGHGREHREIARVHTTSRREAIMKTDDMHYNKPVFANARWPYDGGRTGRDVRGSRGVGEMNELTARLGIQYPIIQGPMGGGPSTPELVAAVSNAGGLGSLGAAYLTPDQIVEAVRRVRSLTDKPFNVNLFAGGYGSPGPVDPGPMLTLLADAHRALELPPPQLPPWPADPFADQFDAVMESRPPVFSFTWGIPRPDVIRRLQAGGVAVIGTATTVQEARMVADAGVDAVVLQGEEAGAHRGTFAGPFEAAMVPTLDLVVQSRQVVSVPVIASGGLMDGLDVDVAMRHGASAVQFGTAFLACPESGAPEAYKQAILSAGRDTTVVTRAFSGRPARGLRNAFTEALAEEAHAILPFPLQNALTRPMRTAAGRRGDGRYLSLWAGRGVGRARRLRAGELVRRMVEEMRAGRRGGPVRVFGCK